MSKVFTYAKLNELKRQELMKELGTRTVTRAGIIMTEGIPIVGENIEFTTPHPNFPKIADEAWLQHQRLKLELLNFMKNSKLPPGPPIS